MAPLVQHLALSVPDPERSAAYYAAALAPLGAFSRRAHYESADRGEHPLVVGVEHSLSLMLHQCDTPDQPVRAYASGAVQHFAIHVDTTELVDEVASAVPTAGGRVTDGPRFFPNEYRFGYYGAFLRDPDEIKWEVFCYTELAAACSLAVGG